jgi:hypothetical protein
MRSLVSAWSEDGARAAITAPRGRVARVFEADGSGPELMSRMDVCGVAPAPGGLAFSVGTGALALSRRQDRGPPPPAWHNHMVALA